MREIESVSSVECVRYLTSSLTGSVLLQEGNVDDDMARRTHRLELVWTGMSLRVCKMIFEIVSNVCYSCQKQKRGSVDLLYRTAKRC